MPKSNAFPPGERPVVAALCLMLGVVPLVYLTDVFECVTSPKLFALHAGVALACVGWLLAARRERGASRSPLTLPALCWMGVALLAAPGTTQPLDTLAELLNQAALVALLFVATDAFPPARLRALLWTCALTGLIVAVLGILQYHGLTLLDIPSAAPPSATFGNRNLMAEYLVCAMPLSALLFLVSRSRTEMAVSGLSTALMGVCLVYARTRSAWVGLTVALLVTGGALMFAPGMRGRMGEAVREFGGRPGRAWATAFAVLFLALSVLPPRFEGVAQMGVKTGVADTAASILQKDATHDAGVRERLTFWANTLRMVADHPLLGVGPGGWARAYPPYDRGVTISPENTPRYPHNDYLWIAAEYGLLGLTVYLWFLIAGFRCLLRAARSRDPLTRLAAPAFALSLLALFGAACFGFPKNEPPTAMFPYLLFGLAAGAMSGESDKVQPSPLSHRGRGWGRGLPYLFLLVSLTATVFSWKRIDFDRHYLRALSWAQPPERWEAVLSEARRALEEGNFRPHLLFVRGIALQGLSRFPEAEDAFRQALAATPNAWYVREGLGLVCAQQGRPDEAIAHFRAALALCPNAAGVHDRLGLALKSKGDLSGAIEQYRQALRIKPDAAEILNDLGVALIVNGDANAAIQAWQQALHDKPDYAEARYNLGAALQQGGDLSGAIEQYRQALRLRPDYARARYNLGTALADGGDRAGALEAFRACLRVADATMRQRAGARIRELGETP